MREVDNVEAVFVHDDLPMIRLRRHQHEFRMHDADFPAIVEAKCERVKRSCFQTFPESFGTHASECTRAAAGLKPRYCGLTTRCARSAFGAAAKSFPSSKTGAPPTATPASASA